ncbi:putative long-chain-fatty-acid--CoA ligase [Fragilariopsis cylindrus CCMP1102]|uniref:Putative long-chain-fatty-acid--CoA ligase n=1 Tax=Fragilariopsis cylindrus CCMP1102 TaxID=635003 RepID=A0A1E7FQ48_9STRA|nr:putative long-chain-fatty-acid--CoA ligase [Fragilariopsis cylindrus CCMP1102]|eukprot:OEU20291.1 putative long-chain-fatty-acid--CoA ligase [Fragilariopsis cylindrus CCMP1102]
MTLDDEEILFGHEDKETIHPIYPQRHRPKDRNGNLLEDPNKLSSLDFDLDYSTTDPLVNKLRTIRDSTIQNCPQLWIELSKVTPNAIALIDDHLCDQQITLTYQDMNKIVTQGSLAFSRLGLTKGQHIAILAENSVKWLQIDHSIQRSGGVSAVRGADAPLEELRYIYEHSDSANIVVLQGPKLLQKLLNNPPASVDMDGEITISFWDDVLEKEVDNAEEAMDNNFIDFPTVTKNDLATIVYTSGTTGSPKGVMLTHGNLLHQTSHRLGPTKAYDSIDPLPNETMVSLLPVWHITERSFELWMLSRGCKVVYSSIRYFKADMVKYQPEWLVLVPRVLEKIALGIQDKFNSGSKPVKLLSSLFTKTSNIRSTHTKISNGLIVGPSNEPSGLRKLTSKVIVKSLLPLNLIGDKLVWSKIQNGFGGNLKCIISGGSALPGNLESFYENAGLNLIVGYGLTECAPLLAFRRLDNNLVTGGCCGKPCLDTEVRVVDPESKSDKFQDRPALQDGEIGVVIGRGPQIMKGYYKNIKATKEAIDEYGWFDTGDLGRINPCTGDLILTGRVKDTIVLSNGENIEPTPIEDAILGGTKNLVEQVMLTTDERKLIAITVLSPTELYNLNYLSKDESKQLQTANELMNDPRCTIEDCEVSSKLLQSVSEKLRNNKTLQKTLVDLVKTSTKEGFRSYENVNTIYITLEPFAMCNGQLTQSYKVKRDSVYECYGNVLPK